MNDLGGTLRAAREAAGLSLSGMAKRAGYSRSYLGNVETGQRQATPAVIRAYERALDSEDSMNRRQLFTAAAAAAVSATVPDVAVDVVRDIAAERNRLLATVQTSHETDRVIGHLVAKDTPCVGSLVKWMRNGSPVLRVNSAGILSKIGSPALDNDVIAALRTDQESAELYLTAVASRVLRMPWDDARNLARGGLVDSDALPLLTAELGNEYDSGARWCAVVLLARMRDQAPAVRAILGEAVQRETSRENLRTIGTALAGLPLS